ncbi:MAG: hypothetical protein JSV49_11775 [Thermoplasmata archaeon]|nr:MAG: hypothetical protein JSV49_11775 [Thermoplasmata archaeon]
MSKIVIHSNGNVTAIISEKDYNDIKAPVAYHTLCENIVDMMATSFIEFSAGNHYGFEMTFQHGPNANLEKPKDFSYPKFLKWNKKDLFDAVLLIGIFTSGAFIGYSFQDAWAYIDSSSDLFIPYHTILVIILICIVVLAERSIRKVKFF